MGSVSGGFETSPQLHVLDIGWSKQDHSLRSEVLSGEEILQGRWSATLGLKGLLHPLTLSWLHAHDLQTATVLQQGMGIGYRSDCDCLEIDVGGLWSVDRNEIDWAFAIRIP